MPDFGWVTLGPCHYGGVGDDATLIVRRRDGTGWVPVCERHLPQAERDGYERATRAAAAPSRR